jgi:hypothetical protein
VRESRTFFVEGFDFKIDIYAFATVMAMLLRNERPHSNEHFLEVAQGKSFGGSRAFALAAFGMTRDASRTLQSDGRPGCSR